MFSAGELLRRAEASLRGHQRFPRSGGDRARKLAGQSESPTLTSTCRGKGTCAARGSRRTRSGQIRCTGGERAAGRSLCGYGSQASSAGCWPSCAQPWTSSRYRERLVELFTQVELQRARDLACLTVLPLIQNRSHFMPTQVTDSTPSLAGHGASQLTTVYVDTYNAELRDGEGSSVTGRAGERSGPFLRIGASTLAVALKTRLARRRGTTSVRRSSTN